MKLFDLFRRNPEPIQKIFVDGCQPHGMDFRYLCKVCLRRFYKKMDVCDQCRCECYPGFMPDVCKIEKLLKEEEALCEAIKKMDKIRKEVLGDDAYEQEK